MALAKHVIGGTGLIALAGGVARLLSFITVPILSRILGPEPYGVAALAGTLVALASTLALLGSDMAYARFYLQEGVIERESVERFCWRWATLCALSMAGLVSVGSYTLGQRWLLEDYQVIAAYSGPSIVLSVMVTMATTRIRLTGNYRKLAAVTLGTALISVAVSLGAAKFWRTDVWVLLLGTLAGSLSTLLLLGLPKYSVLTSRSKLPRETKHKIFMLGISGSITAPMFWIISSSDRWFLAKFATEASIGIYSMAANVALLGLLLNSSLTLTWFPEISRVYGQDGTTALAPLGRLWGRLVVALALVWVAISAAGGDILRLMAAPQFHAGAAYIPWLAGGVFFYGLAALANTAFFLKGRMGPVAGFWVAGALVSLALNTWWVPRFAALGAAIVQTSSYALIALGILIASRRILPLSVQGWRLGLCLIIALSVGVLMSPAWSDNPYFSLLRKFPVGVLVTMLLVWIIAPDWFSRALGGIRRGMALGKC